MHILERLVAKDGSAEEMARIKYEAHLYSLELEQRAWIFAKKKEVIKRGILARRLVRNRRRGQ